MRFEFLDWVRGNCWDAGNGAATEGRPYRVLVVYGNGSDAGMREGGVV